MSDDLKVQIIDECRSWIGTKWRHYCKIKGYGVDCIWLVVEVFKSVGLLGEIEIPYYTRDWALRRSESLLEKYILDYCYEVDKDDLDVGDLLLYKYGKCSSHVAIYIGNNRAIHSHIKRGVVEFDLNEKGMPERLTKTFRLKLDNVKKE
jgi:NlpC/P60 family putative phage cell wall peptidase